MFRSKSKKSVALHQYLPTLTISSVMLLHFQCIEYYCAVGCWHARLHLLGRHSETLRVVSSILGQINTSPSSSLSTVSTRDQFSVTRFNICARLKNVSARVGARNASCVCHLAGIISAPDCRRKKAARKIRLNCSFSRAKNWRRTLYTQEKVYENPSCC